MATAFNTQGAVPTNTATPYNANIVPGSTPASRALSSAAGDRVPTNTATPYNASVAPAAKPVDFSQTATTSGLIPSSQTHTNVDGSSVTTKYQAPQTTTTPKTQADPTLAGMGAAKTPAEIATETGQTQTPQSSPDSSVPTTFPGFINSAATAAQGNLPIGQSAADIAKNYGQQISDIGQRGAAARGGYLTTGTTPVAEGNAAVIAQTTAAQQAAAAAGESAALQGTGQQLTAQNQAQTGFLGAANATAPTGNFPFAFNPLTGQFSSGAGTGTGGAAGGAPTLTYNPQNDANTLASAVIANKVSYQDAVSALGYAGNVGQGLLTTAITAQGGNLANIEAKTQANQQNISTATTAGVNAANTAYSSAVQKVSQATAQYTAASGVASNLTDTLGSWTQNGQLTNLNQALNKVASLTSSPQYSQFIAALTNTQAAYTAAFQTAGITPTQSTQNALQELNPNSSATAILASLNQLSSDLHAATIVPAYQQQQTYAQQLGLQ